MKSRYIYELKHEEWKHGKDFMLQEVAFITWNHPLRNLLFKAISDYESGKFSYDGATFVRERSKSKFEVAAFIHDWRNAMGYVGYYIDNEMFNVMILLNYELSDILKRYLLTRLTFINIIRHKYFTKNYLKEKPKNLIKMKKDFSWNLKKDYDGI